MSNKYVNTLLPCRIHKYMLLSDGHLLTTEINIMRQGSKVFAYYCS